MDCFIISSPPRLPSELWELVIIKLIEIKFMQQKNIGKPDIALNCRLISKYFDELISNSSNIKYILFIHKHCISHISPLLQFNWACENGRLDIAKYLIYSHLVTVENVKTRWNHIFQDACSNGFLELSIWLASILDLTPNDVRKYKNYALRWSCAHGHLKVAKWLVKTFNLTIIDAGLLHHPRPAGENFYLPYGHENTVTVNNGGFGVYFFDRQYEKIRKTYIDAFNLAIKFGQLSVIKWIAKKFDLTVDNIKDPDNGYWPLFLAHESDYPIFNEKTSEPRLKSLQLLTETFSLTKEIVLNDNANLLYMACHNGHLRILKWIVTAFDIGTGDVKNTHSLERCEYPATRICHTEPSEWIKNVLNIDNPSVTGIKLYH